MQVSREHHSCGLSRLGQVAGEDCNEWFPCVLHDAVQKIECRQLGTWLRLQGKKQERLRCTLDAQTDQTYHQWSPLRALQAVVLVTKHLSPQSQCTEQIKGSYCSITCY